MTPLKRFAAGAAVAALLASGSACSNDEPVAAPTTAASGTTALPSPTASETSPSPTATTATPTPKATPTLTQRQQAEADAIAMVKKYYALSDKLAAKPVGVAEAKRQLSSVATSDELSYRIFDISQLREAKQRQTGAIVVASPHVESINLTSKPAAKPAQVPMIKVRFCRDVSELDLFNAAGTSIANPKRQMRRVAHAELVNSTWPSRAGWRVRDVADETTPC